MLSMLTYRRWNAHVRGLDAFPKARLAGEHPLALLQLSHHGWSGNVLRRHHGCRVFLLWRGKSFQRPLDALDPDAVGAFPYIANTAGWMTAELGRQPWLVYGLMRTEDGYSTVVSAGNGMFTLWDLWVCTLCLAFLFLFLIWREIEHGPAGHENPSSNSSCRR
jgi:cytochrome bd ubiquinol oxidase subunit I